MFNYITLLLAQAAAVVATTSTPEAPVPVAAAPATPQTGKIIMYRGSSIMGMALGCPIRFHEREVVELGRGKFAEWVVPAGQYILTNKTSSVQVIVGGGDTQYVRCQIKPGFMSGRADLQMVDRESFEEHKADFSQKPVEISFP